MFQDQKIEFQFKCMDFLLKKKQNIFVENRSRDILCILSMSPKKIAKACKNCLRFSIHRQETTLYRFFNALVLFRP